jgi:hypothetical protein
MRTHRFGRLLACALALCAQRASAFLDPPYLTPANPVAGEAIFVNIFGGECDVADDGLVWPPPVTQQGNAVNILLAGIHEGDPEWCNIGVGTQSFPLGFYPPGSYTLDVERRYMTVFGTWHQETLGVIPFVVSGIPAQQPVEASTLNVGGLAALLLALIAAAHLTLRPQLIAPRF